jgi:hypothetical protein
MRSYHKGWQDKRPGWTRRARWFKPGSPTERIRIEFTDQLGKINRFYENETEATAEYEAFIAERANTIDMMWDA